MSESQARHARNYKLEMRTKASGPSPLTAEFRELSDFQALDIALYTGRESEACGETVYWMKVYRQDERGEWHAIVSINLKAQE